MTEQDHVTSDTETTDAANGSGSLNLTVQVEKTGDCQRHVTVEIAPEDVRQHLDATFSEFAPQAAIPGFRAGRAPRKLVQQRFREELAEQTKARLVAQSLDQAIRQENLSAISEPDFDFGAVILPEDGPMVFEFDIEVRPEFDLPDYKGLSVKRPVWSDEYVEAKVDQTLADLLYEAESVQPKDGPAEAGDRLMITFTSKKGDEVVRKIGPVPVILRQELVFLDGRVDDFADKMTGVASGETRTLQSTIDVQADPNNGQTLTIEAKVELVESLVKDEVPIDVLESIGPFETVDDVRHAIAAETDQQLSFRQRQEVRRAISKLLTESANWTLPPTLLKRQFEREYHRYVMELQTSGFGREDIRKMQHEIRRKSQEHTEQALKEHFILERIAEERSIEPTDADFEAEVQRLATSMKTSPRRVRARLEREGLIDTLRNQIVENKVLDLVAEDVAFEDEPVTFEPVASSVIDERLSLGPVESAKAETSQGGDASSKDEATPAEATA